uniref:Delta-like protein n=1 Tax=Timema genevievae TaxID=629358 RepID=A0A7R9PMV5_TIMGE|nr:unnamed protein product [Timema genevievae]
MYFFWCNGSLSPNTLGTPGLEYLGVCVCECIVPQAAGGNLRGETLITRLTTQRWLDVGPDWTEDEHQSAQSVMRYEYRVTCDAHYYGAGCASLCRPRDDSFGHYNCSLQGERKCVAGWQGDYCTKLALITEAAGPEARVTPWQVVYSDLRSERLKNNLGNKHLGTPDSLTLTFPSPGKPDETCALVHASTFAVADSCLARLRSKRASYPQFQFIHRRAQQDKRRFCF